MIYSIPWNINRTSVPATVVPVDDLIDAQRADGTTEQLLIEAMGRGAEEALEDELSAALLTQTWVLRLDWFPEWEIKLPRPPLQSVTSVQYVDGDGATQVLATTEYVVDAPPANSKWSARPGRIHLAYDKIWPVTRSIPNAVTVTYVAGVTAAESVPEMVRIAIWQTFGDLFENRERSATEAVKQLEMYERLVGNYRCVAEFIYR